MKFILKIKTRLPKDIVISEYRMLHMAAELFQDRLHRFYDVIDSYEYENNDDNFAYLNTAVEELIDTHVNNIKIRRVG